MKRLKKQWKVQVILVPIYRGYFNIGKTNDKSTSIGNVLVPIYRGYFNIINDIITWNYGYKFSSPFIEDTSILKCEIGIYSKEIWVLVPIYRGYFNIGELAAILIDIEFSSPFIEDTSILHMLENSCTL